MFMCLNLANIVQKNMSAAKRCKVQIPNFFPVSEGFFPVWMESTNINRIFFPVVNVFAKLRTVATGFKCLPLTSGWRLECRTFKHCIQSVDKVFV